MITGNTRIENINTNFRHMKPCMCEHLQFLKVPLGQCEIMEIKYIHMNRSVHEKKPLKRVFSIMLDISTHFFHFYLQIRSRLHVNVVTFLTNVFNVKFTAHR